MIRNAGTHIGAKWNTLPALSGFRINPSTLLSNVADGEFDFHFSGVLGCVRFLIRF